MKKLTCGMLMAAVLVLQGCAISGMQPGSPLPAGEGWTIIVLGVTPEVRVQAWKGELGPSGWSIDKTAELLTGGVMAIVPKDGYIVAKVPPLAPGPTRYALAKVVAAGFRIYQSCPNDNVATFEAPSGKVIYLGHVRYELAGEGLSTTYSQKPEEARAYLDAKYPAFLAKLEDRPFTVTRVESMSCGL